MGLDSFMSYTFLEYVGEKTRSYLIHTAQKIKHSPDYGYLFWNQELKKVHWTAADGDGFDPRDEHPLTSLKQIEKMFREIPGVKDVEIGDEWSPKGDGWERIEYRPGKR